MKILRLDLRHAREGWIYRTTYSYEGTVPRAPAQRVAVADFLEARAREMRAIKPTSMGQADNFQQKPLVRRSDWLIDRGEVND